MARGELSWGFGSHPSAAGRAVGEAIAADETCGRLLGRGCDDGDEGARVISLADEPWFTMNRSRSKMRTSQIQILS